MASQSTIIYIIPGNAFGGGPASICEKMGHCVKDSVTEQGLHSLTPWAHVTVDLRILRMNRTFY
jgi:hypothetical protein